MNNTVYYALITFAIGVGIPIMASLNGMLGVQISTPKAASILFALALSISLIVSIFSTPSTPNFHVLPWYYYFGGVFVAIYVLCITWVAPKFGVGNAVFFVLLGQICAASVIDHFGLFGTSTLPISTTRILGIVLMTLGVFLARKTA